MSKSFKYLTIYKTFFFKDSTSFKIITYPTKIEAFDGPRTYTIPIQVAHRFPKDQEKVIAKATELSLSADFSYIAITTETKKKNANQARRECEHTSNTATAILSTLFRPEIFDELIYRGWVIENNWGIMEATIDPTNRIQDLAPEKIDVTSQFTKLRKNLLSDVEMRKRFSLMARFWSKALSYEPCEERFLLLWTILEIFPMKDTTNIKPIAEYCAIILGKEPDVVKEKLQIGRLYSHRCQLVHNGEFPTDVGQMAILFDKLENIIYEIFRKILGLSYSGSLDIYL